MSNGQTSLINDMLRNSVTSAELQYSKPVHGSVRFLIGLSQGGISQVMRSLPDLSTTWSHQRDNILAGTVMESMWCGAVGIALMKLASQPWDVEGEPAIRKERARTIIRGWDYIGQIKKGFADYLLRDNGWWIEVVRQSSAAGSRVLGLNYLSSARCWPTGNPEIPCVYWDWLGHYHELRAHQVMRFVDMPDGANPLGVGVCAAHRAYDDIRQYAAVRRYMLEKVTGSRPLSLYFVTGVTNEQIESAMADSKEKREAEGIVAFGGAVIIPFIQREGISMVEIPLSKLPDNFNHKELYQITNFSYANALPLVTSLDLMPMTGQRAGSGAQSQVIDDASIMKEDVKRALALAWNNQDVWHVLPTGTTFYFIQNDLANKQREAQIVLTRTTAAAMAVEKIGLNPELGVEWLVEEDVMPISFAPKRGAGPLSAEENIDMSGDGMITPLIVSGVPDTSASSGAKPAPSRPLPSHVRPTQSQPAPKPNAQANQN